MDPLLVGAIGVIGLLVAILLGIHVGIALGLVGFLGVWWLTGNLNMAFGIIATSSLMKVTVFAFTCLPMFVLMGLFAIRAGLGQQLFAAGYKWVGRLPGGLAIATVFANAAFGSVTGSSAVAVTVFTKVALPEMRRYSYDERLASASVLSGALLGMLIPPSVLAVLYGIITDTSIGSLLLAGIGPGILMTCLYSLYIYGAVRIKPSLAPMSAQPFSCMEKVVAVKDVAGIVVIFGIVIGGIYMGIFSPTEAGAAGAFVAMLLALALRKLNLSGLGDAALETTRTTTMLFMIIMTAVIFSKFLALSGLPTTLSEWLIASNMPPTALVLVFVVMYLALGTILDATSMMFITLPIVHPIIVALGLNPVWFATIVIVSLETGALTPPVGLGVYVMKATAPEMDVGRLFAAALPICIASIIGTLILVFVKPITLFIPTSMLGG